MFSLQLLVETKQVIPQKQRSSGIKLLIHNYELINDYKYILQ